MRSSHWSTRVAVVAAALLVAVNTAPASGLRASGARARWLSGKTITLSPTHLAPIPSFSRQTKLACNVCHTAFLQLTPFGRLFKLNGYTMTGSEKLTAAAGAAGAGLSLELIPPLSVMAQTSLTHVANTPPGTQNNSVEFPDQVSLFVGGAVTPRIGTFLQFTYSGPDGSFSWDNADIRYANQAIISGRSLIYGLTLNNNPSVQDVWNGTPAWSWPFAGSSVAPAPAAATAVEGALAQRVAGLGAYVFFDNHVYAELSGYRSAPQGGSHPADGSSEMTLKGVSPYWRVAFSDDGVKQSIELGTFGLATRQYPSGISGTTDRYLDVGFDAQYQRFFAKSNLTAHGSFIREHQHLDASFDADAADNSSNTLRTFKADAQLVLHSGLAPGLGYFGSSGSVDATLYPSDAVTGSATGKPSTNGITAELSFNPWLNARLTAQYIIYTKFNGASSNYDGAGRNASDNNTLYLLLWVVF